MDPRAARRTAEEHIGQTGGFLIQDADGTCRECWGCVRFCPAHAIRVADGRSEVIQEKCVKCGLCVSECGNCGHFVRDDTPAVEALLASGRPVVAVLATEFVAAMYPTTPVQLEAAMEAAGFYAVESTLLGEEMVAGAYERLHARDGGLFVLRSTCAVAVSWVERYHPALVPALAPLVPPYVAQARLVRALYPEDTAIVYVSPCYARKDEIADEGVADAVDAAIDFTELKRLLARNPAEPPPPKRGARRPSALKEVSLTDGFPRRAVEEGGSRTGGMVVTRGLRQLDELLRAMEHGEAGPAVVDMLNCEGCIDGPAVAPGMSVFARRNLVAAEREAHRKTAVGSRALLRYLPSVELRRSFKPRPLLLSAPAPEEIDAELARGEFRSRAEALDCGACGSRTCVEHAVAVLRGDSSWDMCFPLQKRRLTRCKASLAESSTLDALTGLWNRRVFSERLAEESARAARYETPLSLLMLDVDDFKGVNDRFGHVAGDCVLAAVGKAMRDSLRATDMPARFGGDEFAVILPGTTAQEARRVAEKLQAALRALTFSFEADGYTREVGVSVSVGGASLARPRWDPTELLEAADRAMYAAKGSGKDQVRVSSE
ncbi:MAG: diguanylate cyclase [Coriobacteriia bacterium]|nr:diguanylate cyclase [Coriobacteriia bacterium]